MLGRKGSIECGTKSILYLILVFAFYGKASDAGVYKEFGCEFANTEYWRQRTAMPIFGHTSDIYRLESTLFSTNITDNFVNIVEPMQKTIFSEPNIMNDVSLFTKFVKDYKNSSDCVLESFFNNYYKVPIKRKEYYDKNAIKPMIRKTYDPVSYIIQEFHALKAYLEKINKSVSPYLVSAHVDPISIDFSDVEIESSEMEHKVSAKIPFLILKRVQDHVAGIIKLEADDRKGYILMDPGYANGVKLYHPFIVYVMEDGKPPHGEFITNPMNENLVFTTGGVKESSYILVQHNNAQSETKYVVYYVAKSYCSFMENTVKANIMRFNHGIVARTTNGTKQAYLTFKISSANKTVSLRNYKKENIDKTDINQMEESFTKSMENAFDLPPTEITAITNEFKYIQTNVIENPQMMSNLNNMAKRLDLDKEQRLKYPEPVETKQRQRLKKPEPVVEEKPKTSSKSCVLEKMKKLFCDIIDCKRDKVHGKYVYGNMY